jgi:carboxylesterase type B
VHAQIALQAGGTETLFKRAIMQSGTLAVMGFIDKESMAQLWKKALVEAEIESNDAALKKMRDMSAQQIMSNPALQASRRAVVADCAA